MGNVLSLYLIRHSESELNLTPNIICGQSVNIGLSDLGREQSKSLWRRFKREGMTFDKVYSSTARRTIETANIACLGLPCDILSKEELLELHQGDWEGQIRSDKHTEEVLNQIKLDPWNFKAPNGESQKEVGERMTNFVNKIIDDRSFFEKSEIAIFGHGFSFKCFLRELLNFDAKHTYYFNFENTSVSHLKYNYDEQKWLIFYLNDFSHLR